MELPAAAQDAGARKPARNRIGRVLAGLPPGIWLGPRPTVGTTCPTFPVSTACSEKSVTCGLVCGTMCCGSWKPDYWMRILRQRCVIAQVILAERGPLGRGTSPYTTCQDRHGRFGTHLGGVSYVALHRIYGASGVNDSIVPSLTNTYTFSSRKTPSTWSMCV